MSLILSEELEASPVEDQKLQQKDRKGVKGKAKKKYVTISSPRNIHWLFTVKFAYLGKCS